MVSFIKKFLVLIIVILLSLGCASKVEIPVRHVGVIKSHQQENRQVLRPGVHLIAFGTEVVIYDTSPASLDIDFDFLFSDTSEGTIKLAIEFSPIPDSLSAFYSIFQSVYVTPVVDQGTRKVVRNLLNRYKPSDLTKEELEFKIHEALTSKHPVSNYVHLSKVVILELRY